MRARVSPLAWPSICQSSSAVCGAKGDIITTSASIASRSTAIVCGALDTAALARSSPRRRAVRRRLAERVQLVDQLHQRRHGGVEVHPLFDVDGRRAGSCRASCGAARARPSVQLVVPHRRHAARRRWSRPSDRRGARRAAGTGSCPRGRRRSTRLPSPAARRTSRTAAARRRRTSASMSSGSTTLPFDFDMTAPSLSTMPCVSRRLNGSSKVDAARRRAARA